MTAPVARPNLSQLPANPNMVRPGTDVIMCLSCHRAHGSPYYKMMRWDYTSTNLLDVLSGCIVCHTSKS
jgi:predicted CXXCH cytochrome family protein